MECKWTVSKVRGVLVDLLAHTVYLSLRQVKLHVLYLHSIYTPLTLPLLSTKMRTWLKQKNVLVNPKQFSCMRRRAHYPRLRALMFH